jgi:catechol 2,3-dioxygenase-like lactoylglutathione lyase family enzyme
MIDHTGLSVNDFAASRAFFVKALAPLGYKVIMEFPPEQAGGNPVAGLGDSHPDLWILGGKPTAPPVHIAFRARNRATVDAFYKAALAAGGRDNGPPGIRAHYHADYYGAFVLDPDGNNIEAVCHDPPGGAAKSGAKAKSASKPASKPKAKAPAKKAKAGKRK